MRHLRKANEVNFRYYIVMTNRSARNGARVPWYVMYVHYISKCYMINIHRGFEVRIINSYLIVSLIYLPLHFMCT